MNTKKLITTLHKGDINSSFLSNIENRMDEILFLGLDITILKFNQEDVVKFQDKLKEISGIDISSIKSYKNILIQKTKNTSKIVSMDKFRNEYSRYFNIAISEELF